MIMELTASMSLDVIAKRITDECERPTHIGTVASVKNANVRQERSAVVCYVNTQLVRLTSN